jgi:hypothetical protein
MSPGPLSLKRVRVADSPFPPRGCSGGYPRFIGTTSCYDSSPFLSLRISCPFARRYRPTLPFASAERTRSPRFLGNPLVRLPCSQTPVGPPRLASRTTVSRGVAVSAPRLRASFRSSVAVHAASRRVGTAPQYWNTEGPGRRFPFVAQSHGLRTRCLRFAAFLSPQGLYAHARLASGCWPSSTGRD